MIPKMTLGKYFELLTAIEENTAKAVGIRNTETTLKGYITNDLAASQLELVNKLSILMEEKFGWHIDDIRQFPIWEGWLNWLAYYIVWAKYNAKAKEEFAKIFNECFPHANT